MTPKHPNGGLRRSLLKISEGLQWLKQINTNLNPPFGGLGVKKVKINFNLY